MTSQKTSTKCRYVVHAFCSSCLTICMLQPTSIHGARQGGTSAATPTYVQDLIKSRAANPGKYPGKGDTMQKYLAGCLLIKPYSISLISAQPTSNSIGKSSHAVTRIVRGTSFCSSAVYVGVTSANSPYTAAVHPMT